MNDDDDVSCAKRCKEKRKSQYPTLNLHVLGLYMYVYLQLQLNSICAYSSSSSLFMIWLLIDYERREKTRNSLSSFRFRFFLLLLQLWLSARIYYCRVLHIIMFAAIFLSFLFSLTCRFHFDLFSFLFFLHASYYNRRLNNAITWAVENSLIMTRLN